MWISNKIKRNLFEMSITDGKSQIKIVINFYANKKKPAGLHRKRGIARTTIQRPFFAFMSREKTGDFGWLHSGWYLTWVSVLEWEDYFISDITNL